MSSSERKTCSNCDKQSGNLKECTGCYTAQYCNRDCQKAHWKRGHKVSCRQHQYLEEWTTQFSVIGFIIRAQIPSERLDELRGNADEVVVMDVDFDYNQVTFLPVEKPRTVFLDDLTTLSSSQKNQFRKSMEEMNSYAERGSGHYPLGVAVLFRGTSVGVIFAHPAEFTRPRDSSVSHSLRETLEETMGVVQDIFHMRMNFVKTESWKSLQLGNVDTQTNVLMRHASYIKFLGNALRLGAAPADQRHTTHVVQINLKFGMGLSEIKQFESFEVKPAAQVRRRLPGGTWRGNASNQRSPLDLVSSSELLKRRAEQKCPSLRLAAQ
jgi:hypothetical protein